MRERSKCCSANERSTPRTASIWAGRSALVSSGGRVLCVTALGDDLEDAQRAAYAGVEKIRMDGGFYRKDIGQKGINRLKGK